MAEFSIHIDLYYKKYEILTFDNNLIDNFWKTPQSNCKKTFTAIYKNGNKMSNPQNIKTYLMTQSTFIESLSLDDYLIIISLLTETYIYIYSFLHIEKNKNSLIHNEKGIPHPQAEIKRADSPLSKFMSLWILLYDIVNNDSTYAITSKDDFMLWCIENKEKN